MSGISPPVLWLVAVASAALLVTAGFVMAVTHLRRRLARSRKHIEGIQSVLAQHAADPYGETRVLWDQLRRLRKRLANVAKAVGDEAPLAALPDLPEAAVVAPAEALAKAPAGPSGATPASDATPARSRSTTRELEADLELFKREVYAKSNRIIELETEKQVLTDKIVHLEEQIRTTPMPRIDMSGPFPRADGEAISLEDMSALVDTLQHEADSLRAELTEREEAIQTMVRQDKTGLFHELARIRKELRSRTDEAASLREKLRRMERLALQSRTRAESLDQEKENLASQALESAADLRRANELIRDLERQLAERPAIPFPTIPGSSAGAPVPPPMPTAPLGGTTLPGLPKANPQRPPPLPPKAKRR